MRADLQKHTLQLRSGDWDYLESIYKPNGLPTSVVIRSLVSEHVDKMKRREGPQDKPDLSGVEL
jgi:hypothetical protein